MKQDYLPKLRAMCPEACKQCGPCRAAALIEQFRKQAAAS